MKRGGKPYLTFIFLLFLLCFIGVAYQLTVVSEDNFVLGTFNLTEYSNETGGLIISNATYNSFLPNQDESGAVNMSGNVLLAYMNDSSGEILDHSGNQNNGTLGGASYSQPGYIGDSISFDGAGDVIDFGDIEMSAWTGITVSAWFKTSSSVANQRIFSKDQVGVNGNFLLRRGTSNKWQFQALDSGTWRYAQWTTTSLHDGEWHHAMGVINTVENKIYLYIDGVEKGSGTFNAATLSDAQNEELTVGADSDVASPDNEFVGNIDEVAIWNRSFSAAEVIDVYNFQAGKFGDSNGIGEYDSEIFDAGESKDWQSVVWEQEHCYNCPLQNFSATEVGHFNGTVDMNNTIFLFHFDEDSFDAQSGGADFYDAGGNYYHSDAVGSGVTLSPTGGRFGGAINLSSATNAVDVGYLNFTNVSDLTMAIWFKISDTSGIERIFSKDRGTGERDAFVSRFNGQNAEFYVSDSSISDWRANIVGVSGVFDGEWHHRADVIDSVNDLISTYIDGELVDTAAYLADYIDDVDNQNITLGDDSDYGDQGYDGLLDEAAMWSRAFDAAEIRALYNRGRVQNVTLSVRSCDDDACSGETFTEFVGNSPQNISSLADNQYIQFQAELDSSLSNETPTLLSVNLSDEAIILTQAAGTAWSCPSGCRPSSENPDYTAPDDFELYSPTNASSDIIRNITLQWNSSTNGSETMNYQLQIATDEDFTAVVVNETGIAETNSSQTEYVVTDDLPVDDIYYWRVRGDDGTTVTSWAPFWQFELLSFVSITLPTNTVEFGSMLLLQNKNTSLSGGYQPITISNDGNIPLNITINGTSFFENSGGVYNFSMEENETGAFSSALLEWTEMNSTAQNALTDLYHENGSNTANVVNLNLLVVVPNEEPSGDKNSTIEVSNT